MHLSLLHYFFYPFKVFKGWVLEWNVYPCRREHNCSLVAKCQEASMSMIITHATIANTAKG